MSHVLIAGGAGFLGSHLAVTLLDQGHHVIVADDLCTGDLSNLPTTHPRLDIHLLDVADSDILLPDLPPLDVIYHLASPASPLHYQTQPLHTLHTNSAGTWALLRLAQVHSARFILTSTSEVYGDPTVHPQPETYWGHVNPIGPRSMYDEGKRFSESLTVTFAREHAVSYGIARLFNAYGPRMRPDDGRAIPTFISQATTGQPLTVHGDGTQTRSCTYVDDVIDAIIALANSTLTGPINIGNPEETTIFDLAHTIITLSGSSSTITFGPALTDDPARRRPDITLATTQLGWYPRVTLREGLTQTLAATQSAILP